MRKCPHCNNDIQDEAVFCRFCRRDVDPPLWLTSLHKCPYCAEWVERGIDACPLCGKLLAEELEGKEAEAQPEKPLAEEKPSRPDPLQRLRQVTAEPEPKAREPEPEPEPEEEAPAPEPPIVDREFKPRSLYSDLEPEAPQRPSLLSRKLVPPVSGEFRRSRVEQVEPADNDISLWSTDQEPPKPPRREIKKISGDSIRRVAVSIVAVLIPVALIILALGPGKPFIENMVNGLSEIAAPDTPQPTVSSSEETPVMASTLPPLDSTEEGPSCLSWEDITDDMLGQVVCVQGEVKRWFSIPDIPFLAIFTEEVGTFAIVDRLGPHPEVRPGTCIRANGPIEVMRGPRLFIDVQGEIEFCDTE